MQKNSFDRKFFKKIEDDRRYKNSFVRKLSKCVSRVLIAATSAGFIIELATSDRQLQLPISLSGMNGVCVPVLRKISENRDQKTFSNKK